MKYDIVVESETLIKCTKGLRRMFAVRKNKILTLTEISGVDATFEVNPGEMSGRMETEANFLAPYNSPRSSSLQN